MNQLESDISSENKRRRFPIVRFIIGLVITVVSVWYLSRDIEFVDLRSAISSARMEFIYLAVVVIIVTGFAKAWRWQLLYYPHRPNYISVYRALMLGQMLNLISPIPRVGDIYRIYQVHQGVDVTRGQTLGTLVSEKSLDFLLTAVMVLILIPFFAVPDFIQNRAATLILFSAGLIGSLYLLVFQAGPILKIATWCFSWLPERLSIRLNLLAERTLNGLDALRHPGITSLLILISAGIGLLSILTPLLLFWAFGLDQYGLDEAVFMNTATILSLSVPSAPGKIGTFDSVAVAMLAYFGTESDSLRLSYAIVYHIVAFVPPILIGVYVLFSNQWGVPSLRDLVGRYNKEPAEI